MSRFLKDVQIKADLQKSFSQLRAEQTGTAEPHGCKQSGRRDMNGGESQTEAKSVFFLSFLNHSETSAASQSNVWGFMTCLKV